MAKKKQKAESVWVTDPSTAFDGLLSGIRHRVATATKREQVAFCGSSGMPVVGIPLPHLAQRVLFMSDVYPCGRIVQLTGEEGAGKTPMVYELCKLHLEAGGGATHNQNEAKDQPELREMMMMHNQQLLNRLTVEHTRSVEDWMEVTTATIQAIQAAVKDADGPGRAFPYIITVDSIMGTAARAQIAGIMKTGHASKAYAEEANIISKYMACIPALLDAHPVSIVGTNHLKPGRDERGNVTYNSPGGKSVKFMESYEFRVVRGPDIRLVSMQGMNVKILVQKNSLAPSRYWVNLRLRWRYENDKQYMWWDWGYNSMEYLVRLADDDSTRSLYNRINEVLELRDARVTGEGSVSSAPLGIPRDSPATFAEAALAFERSGELKKEVHRLLGIHERVALRPGIDYRTQVARAAAELAAAEPPLPPPTDVTEGD